MSKDTIYRQDAIEEIDEWIKAFLENGHKESAADACLIQDGIIQLPSAQPEIIRCEYCAHRNQYRFPTKYDVRDYCEVHEKVTTLTNFCSWAERRKDGRSN